MSDVNRIARRGTAEQLKTSIADANKQLGKLQIIVDAFKQAGQPIPEMERVHRHLSNAMAELAKISEGE